MLPPPRKTRKRSGHQEKATKPGKQIPGAHSKVLQVREKQQRKFQEKNKGQFGLISRLSWCESFWTDKSGVWEGFAEVCPLQT